MSEAPPVRPTAFRAELQALGLTPGALPALRELEPMQKLDAMTLIAKSLGVECTHCHLSEQDYKTDTYQKRVAREMWGTLTVGHQLADGPVFCDSCHQGKATFLERQDKAGIRRYMKREYTQLQDSTGAPLKCETCHNKPFEPQIIRKRWGIEELDDN